MQVISPKKTCKNHRISEAVSDITNQQKGTFPFTQSATTETLAFLTTLRNLTFSMPFLQHKFTFPKSTSFLLTENLLNLTFL